MERKEGLIFFCLPEDGNPIAKRIECPQTRIINFPVYGDGRNGNINQNRS